MVTFLAEGGAAGNAETSSFRLHAVPMAIIVRMEALEAIHLLMQIQYRQVRPETEQQLQQASLVAAEVHFLLLESNKHE